MNARNGAPAMPPARTLARGPSFSMSSRAMRASAESRRREALPHRYRVRRADRSRQAAGGGGGPPVRGPAAGRAGPEVELPVHERMSPAATGYLCLAVQAGEAAVEIRRFELRRAADDDAFNAE